MDLGLGAGDATQSMIRMILLCESPHRLSPKEGEGWLREAAASLLQAESIDEVDLVRLAPGAAWSSGYNWLFDLRSSSRADATSIASEPRVVELVGDMYLLGMHPAEFIVAETIRITPTA